MTYKEPRTWTDHELMTAALLNDEVKSNLYALYSDDYSARVYRTTNQTITTGTLTAVSFSTEVYDNEGFWVVGSPTRFTIPVTASYKIGGCVRFASSAKYESLSIRLNGTTYIHVKNAREIATAGVNSLSIGYQYKFTSGDYVELIVHHFHGSNLDIVASSKVPNFWISLATRIE